MPDDPKKPGEGGTPDPDKKDPPKLDPASPPPDPAKELEAERAKVAALNKENEARRKENKDLKTKFDGIQEALQTALGTKKPEENIDAVKAGKLAAEAKSKMLLLKSAFVSVAAKEMHDADWAFNSLASDLKDVEVNLETETVDKAALTVKLGEIKKSHPFLFAPVDPTKPPPKVITKPPDGNGRPGNGGTQWQEWTNLKQQNRSGEAQEFYNKNKAAILSQIP